MYLEIDLVLGPDGKPDPVELEVGTRIEISVRPFGVGPGLRIVSVIADRTFKDGSGSFPDLMESGPFVEGKYAHRFFNDGDGMHLVDRIEYRFPWAR